MADALVPAGQQTPDAVVDIATVDRRRGGRAGA